MTCVKGLIMVLGLHSSYRVDYTKLLFKATALHPYSYRISVKLMSDERNSQEILYEIAVL